MESRFLCVETLWDFYACAETDNAPDALTRPDASGFTHQLVDWVVGSYSPVNECNFRRFQSYSFEE